MRKIKAVLFDLDGTLLPMNNDEFTKGYFKLLAAKLAPHGYDPKQLVDSIWAGTAAMVKNNGEQMNEVVFWSKFAELLGDKVLGDKPLFDEFYLNEFSRAKAYCGYNEKAAEAVAEVKRMGCVAVLATNPIFPVEATKSRAEWAGVSLEDFGLYTSYENIGCSKPNPEYYREIAKRLGVSPEECLMVGNDAAEDMIAEAVGMQVFLLTDHLVNKEDKDISGYNQGSFDDLLEFLRNQER